VNSATATTIPAGREYTKVRIGHLEFEATGVENTFRPRRYTDRDCTWALVGETMVIVTFTSSESMFGGGAKAKIAKAVATEQRRQDRVDSTAPAGKIVGLAFGLANSSM